MFFFNLVCFNFVFVFCFLADCGQGDQQSPSADKDVTSHKIENPGWDFGGGEHSEITVDDLTTDQSTKTNEDVTTTTCTDPAYATVTSVGSALSRDSSTDILLPNLSGGIVEFVQEGAERNQTVTVYGVVFLDFNFFISDLQSNI